MTKYDYLIKLLLEQKDKKGGLTSLEISNMANYARSTVQLHL